MTVKRDIVEVPTSYDVTVRNLYLHREPAGSKLLVLLPGRNYSCDRPALHYLRLMALQHGWDVLSLQYSFQLADVGPTEAELYAEVRTAVAQVLGHGYQALCFAGKSMGTPLAVKLARAFKAPRVCLLLLTPLESALEHLDGLPALVLIGTADPLYETPAVQAARRTAGVQWHEFADLNHSLEIRGDWQHSAAALPQLVGTCERFLTAGALARS